MKATSTTKKGASNDGESKVLHIPLSIEEGYRLLEETSINKFLRLHQQRKQSPNSIPGRKSVLKEIHHLKIHANAFKERKLKSLFFRIRLNAFITKFSKNVKCMCGGYISNNHIILDCQNLKPHLPVFSEKSLEQVLSNVSLMFEIAKSLSLSPIGHLL